MRKEYGSLHWNRPDCAVLTLSVVVSYILLS